MDTAAKILLLCFLLQGICCRDFNISFSEKIKALSGSCVIIKCRFEINATFDKDLTEKAIGVWLKDGPDAISNRVFNSSSSVQNIVKGNITGKLQKDKDCTTVFYDIRSNDSGQYFFRIEGEGPLKWTFTKHSVSVDVIESPAKPTVKLYEEQKEVQGQEEVLEGRSVSLRCSAETLCSSPPPTLTWSSTPRIPLSESSRPQELISDLNFTATHRHHRVTFTCTIRYQLQDKSKTAHNNITLHVQYAPKISSSSSCNRTDVTVCVCEVDGNPSPKVEWHLSGRPVSNSSHISEERLGGTGFIRSFITLQESLTHTSTLQCVSNNTHGTDTKLFPSSVASLGLFYGLIGAAVVALLVIMLSAITCVYIRKCKFQPDMQEKGAKRSGRNADEGNEDDSAYVMMSSAEGARSRKNSIIYSSIDFTNHKPRSQEVGSVSLPHTDNSVVRDCREGLTKAESSMEEPSGTTEVQVILTADVVTKQTESKESEEELFVDSSQIYAKVKRRNP